MPCTVVVGGQYGSEGKGKVVALLSRELENPWVVRCGGPNSGHTVTIDEHDTVLRQVPSAPDHPNATLCLSAGCAIDEAVLLNEIDRLSIARDRIIIDPRAVLITENDRVLEDESLKYIGSTRSGTGAAIARRMSRAKNVRLAEESSYIHQQSTVYRVADLLQTTLADGGDVIIEGTQGFGLSLLHGPDYPYVTSRDTTAAAFAMEAGLSPFHMDRIIMVVRTFPIRVGGNSGPLANETTWEEIQKRSGAPIVIPEYTSVTHRLRRVAFFDVEAVKMACRYNIPTGLAIMGIDRLDYENHRVARFEDLTNSSKQFVNMIETETGVPVEFIGTGFATNDAFELVREVSPLGVNV